MSNHNLQNLGKYRIVEKIGRGGFATVYRAEDTTLGREVALKILHPQLLTDPGWVDRFHREARTIARLRHPHIVTIYEIGETDARLYIAMDLITGGSTRAWLATKERFTWPQTLEIVRQVADALEYAHGEGVLHRDLKPANILLDPRAGAILTDFGFAKLVGDSSISASLSGGVMGTPAYIAPEIWDGEPARPQTDVYALGCIVYELLIGARLFAGEKPSVVMRKHLLDGPQFPTTWPEDTPPDIEGVLRRFLARKMEERYVSAGAVLRDLEALRQTRVRQPETVTTEPPATPLAPQEKPATVGSSKRETPTWAWALLGLVALAMLAGLGMLVTNLPAAPAPTATLFPTVLWTPSPILDASPMPAPTDAPTRSPTHTATPNPTSDSTPAPTVTLLPGGPPAEVSLEATWTRPTDDAVMVYVPAGEFEMGSTEGDHNEKPVHTVALDAFWLDQTEVTNAQYTLCVAEGECQASIFADDTDYEGDNYPAVGVSWYDAGDYCEWAGGRLPTEAEWEYAARGPEGYIYPWGNQVPTCKLANHNRCFGGTTSVGSYPEGASWVGALDMAGNVWEWVADRYSVYPSERQVNPTGPTSGIYMVLRGGAWAWSAWNVRSTSRDWARPSDTYDWIGPGGFRCALSSRPKS